MKPIGRVAIAALVLLSLPLASEANAVGSGYYVVSIVGPAPKTMPVPHLPSGFMREGQVLSDGAEYLMLKGTSLILANDKARRIVSVRGPNRFLLRGETLKARVSARVTWLEPRFFSNPRKAVQQTAKWLCDESWVKLALHYDLSGTQIPLSSLCTGSFFVRSKPPEVGHPGGFSRYKQPFAPSFSYQSHRTLKSGEIEVKVHISIDQGGGMVQEGWETFSLRRSAKGLQLLPKNPAAPREEPTVPSVPAGSGPGPLQRE